MNLSLLYVGPSSEMANVSSNMLRSWRLLLIVIGVEGYVLLATQGMHVSPG